MQQSLIIRSYLCHDDTTTPSVNMLDRATCIPLTEPSPSSHSAIGLVIVDELMCSGRVSRSGSICCTRRVTLVRNPMISHEWGNDRIVITKNGIYHVIIFDLCKNNATKRVPLMRSHMLQSSHEGCKHLFVVHEFQVLAGSIHGRKELVSKYRNACITRGHPEYGRPVTDPVWWNCAWSHELLLRLNRNARDTALINMLACNRPMALLRSSLLSLGILLIYLHLWFFNTDDIFWLSNA